jgi:hypothetical protein
MRVHVGKQEGCEIDESFTDARVRRVWVVVPAVERKDGLLLPGMLCRVAWRLGRGS